MNATERLRRNYRAAFLGYLPRRDEKALDAGYQIGRSAVTDGLSILDLAQVHHDVLREVLATSSHNQLDEVTATASEFLIEVLAAYEMTRGGYPAKA
jgi:hypothetical protein